MIVNHDRLVRGPLPQDPHLVKANADTKDVFLRGAFDWAWILDMPGGPLMPATHYGKAGVHFGKPIGSVSPSDYAEVCYVYESGGSFQQTILVEGSPTNAEDTRVELQPLVVKPNEYRRILKVAWAYDVPIEMTLIPLEKAGTLDRSPRRFSRREPPGDPSQPFSFKRVCAHPISMYRMWIVTWESPNVIGRAPH